MTQPVLFDTLTPAARDPRVAFAVKLAEALHTYGVPTHRLEQGMNRVARRLGLQGNFLVTPTSIFVSFGSPEEQRTSLVRVEPGEVDLEKMTRLDELVTQVIQGETDVESGAKRIDEITAAPPRYGPVLSTVCFALASAAGGCFLGGGWREIVITGLVGLLLGTLALIMGRSENTVRVFEPVAAVAAGALAVLAAHGLKPLSVYVTTLASIIVLLPGLTLTTAMRELATRNLVAGTARLMGAALLFFQLGFGVALGWQLNQALPAVPLNTPPEPLAWWALWVALAVAPFNFMVLFRAQPRDLGWIAASCLVSFGGARAGAALLGPELGVCLGAMALGAGANVFARLTRRPSAIALVPGLMLLVPGSLGFGSVAQLIEKDALSGIQTAFSMLLIAVALVTGLLLANVLVAPRKIF
jgi:uncharacterized membrane protein YjjP (DUF1212 family)